MISGRVFSISFALSLALAPAVLPIAANAFPNTNGPLVNYLVAVIFTIVLLWRDPEVDTGDLWTFSVLTFAVAAGLNLLLGTGANSGEASPTVVIVVWMAGAAVAGAFVARDSLQAVLAD